MARENSEENAGSPEERFDNKPVGTDGVVVAGSFMNFYWLRLFCPDFSVIGVPREYSNEIGEVIAGSVAESGGLKPGIGLSPLMTHQPQTGMK